MDKLAAAYKDIRDTVLAPGISNAERVAILELVKAELLGTMQERINMVSHG